MRQILYNRNPIDVFYSNSAQIVDVTNKCDFTWTKEPEPCKAYLGVSNVTGDFTEGETIIGQSSGASASVFSSYVNGDRVYVEDVSGTFQTGETIQGQSSGRIATVDKFVEERSYPDNVIKGNFPNSIVSEDIDDYLEFESTKNGSAYPAILKIDVHKNGNYIVMSVFGVGGRVDAYICVREVHLKTRYSGYSPLFSLTSSYYDRLFATYYTGALGPAQLFPEDYDNECIFISFRQKDKGTYRWRIHNIKILRLLI